MQVFSAALLVGTVLLLSGSSCSRQDPVPVSVPLPQGLKDLAMFRDGTYWIYRNQRTDALDSAYVTGFRLDTVDFKTGQRPKDPVVAHEERFHYDVTSSFTRERLRYYGAPFCVGAAYKPEEVCHAVTYDNAVPDFLFYKPIPGTVRNNGTATVTLVAVLDTLSVGSTLYRQVVQVDTKLVNNPTPSLRHFIAPGAGMVRREVATPTGVERWDLVRARIVQ